jgi:hypothetical protein
MSRRGRVGSRSQPRRWPAIGRYRTREAKWRERDRSPRPSVIHPARPSPRNYEDVSTPQPSWSRYRSAQHERRRTTDFGHEQPSTHVVTRRQTHRVHQRPRSATHSSHDDAPGWIGQVGREGNRCAMSGVRHGARAVSGRPTLRRRAQQCSNRDHGDRRHGHTLRRPLARVRSTGSRCASRGAITQTAPANSSCSKDRCAAGSGLRLVGAQFGVPSVGRSTCVSGSGDRRSRVRHRRACGNG